MTNKEFAGYLRNRMFADRPTIDEAFSYALDMLGHDVGALTALHVLLNTVANQIEKLEVCDEDAA